MRLLSWSLSEMGLNQGEAISSTNDLGNEISWSTRPPKISSARGVMVEVMKHFWQCKPCHDVIWKSTSNKKILNNQIIFRFTPLYSLFSSPLLQEHGLLCSFLLWCGSLPQLFSLLRFGLLLSQSDIQVLINIFYI